MEGISIWSVLGIVFVIGVLLYITFTSKKTKHDLPIAGGCAPVIDENKRPFAIHADEEPEGPPEVEEEKP
ncbi:MAG TPA: hypothetical protein PKH92_09365 [Anaerolineaceae bacterium]|nr:hypothetical protein [Anaerolineaceae bacterium]HQF63278.1 hypothetical protein [Anaerolineaceae bacterium]HQH86294.1 hypothetical protein [Anaerolineaceae bacterium]